MMDAWGLNQTKMTAPDPRKMCQVMATQELIKDLRGSGSNSSSSINEQIIFGLGEKVEERFYAEPDIQYPYACTMQPSRNKATQVLVFKNHQNALFSPLVGKFEMIGLKDDYMEDDTFDCENDIIITKYPEPSSLCGMSTSSVIKRAKRSNGSNTATKPVGGGSHHEKKKYVPPNKDGESDELIDVSSDFLLGPHPHGPEEVSPDEADDDISFDDPKADHGNKKHVV